MREKKLFWKALTFILLINEILAQDENIFEDKKLITIDYEKETSSICKYEFYIL